MGLFSFLHARCDAEAQRSAQREQTLRDEIRRLTDAVVALADKRALQVVNQEPAAPRTEEEKAQRPSLRLPPYANGLATRGHVDLTRVRRTLDQRQKLANNGKPAPVVE